jgi:hypothetical protein
MAHSPTICFDWDGTLTEFVWPDWGDWKPGAVDMLKTMHEAGAILLVASLRISPYEPWTSPLQIERPLHLVVAEEAEMRRRLDEEGLTYVHIWDHTKRGKPIAALYVDDNALRYPDRKNSWKRLTPVILEKVGLDGEKYLED